MAIAECELVNEINVATSKFLLHFQICQKGQGYSHNRSVKGGGPQRFKVQKCTNNFKLKKQSARVAESVR